MDIRKKIKPTLQVNDFVRVVDLKKTFSKSDTTNWSHKLWKITEIFNDTIPIHKIEKLPERYNESLLKKTDLTMKENNSVVEKFNFNWIKHTSVRTDANQPIGQN